MIKFVGLVDCMVCLCIWVMGISCLCDLFCEIVGEFDECVDVCIVMCVYEDVFGVIVEVGIVWFDVIVVVGLNGGFLKMCV